jgi:hypothetical protein
MKKHRWWWIKSRETWNKLFYCDRYSKWPPPTCRHFWILCVNDALTRLSVSFVILRDSVTLLPWVRQCFLGGSGKQLTSNDPKGKNRGVWGLVTWVAIQPGLVVLSTCWGTVHWGSFAQPMHNSVVLRLVGRTCCSFVVKEHHPENPWSNSVECVSTFHQLRCCQRNKTYYFIIPYSSSHHNSVVVLHVSRFHPVRSSVWPVTKIVSIDVTTKIKFCHITEEDR